MKYVIVFIIVVCGIVACKKEKKIVVTPVPKSFSHLKSGNKVIYNFIYNGSITDTLTHTITNSTDGVYTQVLKDALNTITTYLFIENDTLKQFQNPQTKDKAGVFYYYNHQAGYSFNKLLGNTTYLVSIINSSQTLTTSFGNYSCYVWKEKNLSNNFEQTVYFNEAIGVVKITFTYNGKPAEYIIKSKNF